MRIAGFLAGLLLAAWSGGAHATTLTFDLPYASQGTTYSEGGYNFSASALDFYSWGPKGTAFGDAFSADPSFTSATLFNNTQSATVTMTADSGAFNLASMDFADVYNNGYANQINFFYQEAGGGTGNISKTLDTTPGLQTLAFNLSNIVLLSWSTVGVSNQWDNVVVTNVATTPIPATLPLLASGLSGLGLFAWRRRKQPGRGREPGGS